MKRLILFHLFSLVSFSCCWQKSYADQDTGTISSNTQVSISPDMQQLSFSKVFFKHASYKKLFNVENQKIEFPTNGERNDH